MNVHSTYTHIYTYIYVYRYSHNSQTQPKHLTHVQTPYIYTLSRELTSAFAFTNIRTVSLWPWLAALCNGVPDSCVIEKMATVRYTYINISIYICIYRYKYIYLSNYLSKYLSFYLSIYMYIYMCIYIYIYICTYTYIHIHI